MYPLGTWFVSGICVWIPCIKEIMMMMMMIIIIIIIITPSVQLIVGSHFQKVQRQESKVDYSHVSNAKIKNVWSSTSAPRAFFLST